jgi:serine protease Do
MNMHAAGRVLAVGRIKPFIILLLLMLLAHLPDRCQSAETVNAKLATLADTAEAFHAVAQKAKPAVVYVHVKKVAERTGKDSAASDEFFNDPALQKFFGESSTARDRDADTRNTSYGHGSGFIINAGGYILTNAHVVDNAREITVRLIDRREFKATLIGKDEKSDVALIRIEADNLPVMPLGDSSSLKVGAWALAIGSPYEMIQTVTAGIISATGRSSVGISEYEDFIQTDAAINPGNSGGPLVDIYGRAIGINTAFLTQSGGYMGIGFAIPINMAKVIAERLQKNGRMTRAWLGVGLKDLSPDKLQAHHVASESTGAALVSKIDATSPAARSGLRQGDVIVAMDGVPVAGAADLRNRIALTSPGAKVTLLYIRDGRQASAGIVLGEK